MICSRAWFALGIAGVVGLFYAGGGMRKERGSLAPLIASAAYGQETNKHALVWEGMPSIGILPGSAMYRTKVKGGWLVFGTIPSARNAEPMASGLTFVPDPEHQWDGTSLK
jgi:hypothetical protein